MKLLKQLLLTFTLLAAFSARGATNVVTTANDTGAGSLRQTIVNSSSGDTITFTNTLSGATILLTTGELLLNKNLTIDASALPGGITLNGNANGRIFQVAAGTANVLTALTIINGFVSGDGGGINNQGSLTVNECSLVGNVATGFGGGIENSGTLTVNQSTLTANTCNGAIAGAGIDNASGSVTVNQSTVSKNSATDPSSAGGIFIYAGSLTFGNSIVAGNIAPALTNLAAFTPIITNGVNLVDVNPALAPLGNYGGPTPTMPPLPGSPAIDAATNSAATTDQRGFARPVDGDHNGSAVADIGAVEVTQLWVTNNFNSGPGSLRQTLAAAPPFATVGFGPALSGQTITLSSQITITNSLLITGSGLANGITVSGNNSSRVFLVNAGCIVTLDSLTLREGFANFDAGGAILNSGKLTLHACTLSGNRSHYGGGIYTSTGGSVTLNSCTLSGNESQSNGGGMFISGGKITLNACTVSDNQASLYGGGIFIDLGDGTLFLDNTIIAGNTAFFSPDSANIDGTFSGTNNLTDGDPLLAPLGNFGGPTQTMPPLPGSPAIDAAIGSTAVADQRGLKRPSGLAADIGAVEVQNGMQNVIYDSFGFESPRFSLGTLVGQDGANGPWLQAGTGAATVQNTNVAAGAQAVRINRTGADVRFAVVKTNLNVGSSPTPIIAVEWSMKYQPASLPSGSYGPLFGIEVYDDNGAFPSLAASATVDATTSELLYQTPGTGFLTVVPGIIVPPNTWHTYRLELDYSSQTYRLIYDGTEVLTNGFVDPGIEDFTDASTAALAGAGDPTSQNANGTAFFDNYKITALSVGSQILSIARAGAGQVTLSWTPITPGSILLETPSLSPANWTLSPSASTNPVTVPAVANKFYRLYRP